MLRYCALAAIAVGLMGCEETTQGSRERTLEPWRAATVLGGGDGAGSDRRQGQISGSGQIQAGRGTIFPGRQPLFRDSDMTNGQGERTVSLNLVDVSIQEAAAAILGELLGENYILDPAVTGTVNIRSARPISRTTAMEVFELALKQNNAALVRRGDVFSIVPFSGDLSLGASTSREVEPGYTIRVIPLRNIGAQEMATILQPFAGQGVVGIDAQRNIIVLAGTSADHRAGQKTINSFDVDWLANRSVGIFPIKGRSAASIVRGLELVVETDESFEPIAVFETIPENNSILVVAKTPRALESMGTWIQRLTKEGQNDARIYSYDMKYARAGDIAPVLGQILGIQVQASSGNSEAAAQAELEAVVNNFDQDLSGGDQNATRIVASEGTNTLLIHAVPDAYERVVGILHRLDVPPRQVLVEATIVEVSLNEELRYGVQYFFDDNGDSIGLSSGGSQAIAPNLPGFSLVLDTPASVVVDALDDVTSVNVVSSPNLMILNNESARLVVGDQVPVATQQAQDGTQNDEVFVSTVEFRDTGVIFEVTPRINSSGTVILDISQEVSSVTAASGSTLTPTISQRVINSSVSVDSGETIALGGLFEDRSTRGNAGIPLLKDIPVAGKLFGRNTNRDQQTELLVLITPRIVNNTVDARRVTRQLRERVTALRLDDAALSTAVKVPSLRTSNSAFVEETSRRQSEDAVEAQSTVGALVTETLASTSTAPAATTQAAASQPAVQTASLQATAQQPAAQTPTAAVAPSWAVLGAFWSDKDAKRYWGATQRKHRSLLSGLSPEFHKRTDTTLVQVGPIDVERANKICATLGAACRVMTR